MGRVTGGGRLQDGQEERESSQFKTSNERKQPCRETQVRKRKEKLGQDAEGNWRGQARTRHVTAGWKRQVIGNKLLMTR